MTHNLWLIKQTYLKPNIYDPGRFIYKDMYEGESEGVEKGAEVIGSNNGIH